MSGTYEFSYGELQEEGELRQQWITDPTISCPVGVSDLRIGDLDDNFWDISCHPNGLPDPYTVSQMQDIDIPEQRYFLTTAENYSEEGDVNISFKGRVGEGVLFIEDIMRSKLATGPWISEFSKAVYEEQFSLDTLRHIFVVNISNEETRPFVNARLNLGREPKVWESDAPEFKAMLGTRIGKIVAYIVLGAFQRGTRKISRVAMWQTGHHTKCIQARFDIEAIDA